MSTPRAPLSAERLFRRRKIDDASGCWLWTGSKTSAGYGQIRNGARRWLYVHRVAASVLAGLDIEGRVVCHTCDTPACFNPAHLFVGTHADNVRDKIAKGRQGSGTAKLDPERVAEIRRLAGEGGLSQRQIAARFGVTQPTVSEIASGRTWR